MAASLPSIRLRGEDQNDRIREEINSVVRQHVQEIVTDYQLSSTTEERLRNKLLSMKHRTYLWLYLAIDSIRKTFSQSLRPDEETIELLPRSVEDAYERILSKGSQTQIRRIRTILQIVVGARRPLTMGEMTLALDIATSKTIPQSFCDLRVKEDQVTSRIRHWCGLFVFINHSRLYLIHQTAKEFLLRDLAQTWVKGDKWKYCFSTSEVEHLMARIYVLYLCLQEFETSDIIFHDKQHDNLPALGLGCQKPDIMHHKQKMFELAAECWADHWRNIESAAESDIKDKAWILYDTQSVRFSRWTKTMWRKRRGNNAEFPEMSSLTLAAYNGHVSFMRHIIDTSRPSLEVKDRNGDTALTQAAGMGHHDAVFLLLKNGADLNVEGGYYGGALEAASWTGHDKVLRILLDAGVDVNTKEGCALQIASENGHVSTVKMLLKAGADAKAKAGAHSGALKAASIGGHELIAGMLLEAGADVNGEGGIFGSPLQSALECNRDNMVKILLDAGADPNTKWGVWDTSALKAASAKGHERIVSLLLKAGADVKAEGGYYGWSALHAASANNHEEVVKLLLEAGTDVNAKGARIGETPLLAASARGHENIVRMLLKAGADVNAKVGFGRSALEAALKEGHESIAKILLEAGAKSEDTEGVIRQ